MIKTRFLLPIALCLGASSAGAVVITSTDTADFNLTLEAFPLIPLGINGPIVSTSGAITVSNALGVGAPPTGTAGYLDWSATLPGTEYVMNGDENFDLTFSSPQSAFAMNYEDDSVASIFTLTFFNGASNVGTTAFTTSSFNTANFIGFLSDASFDSITVREDDGSANSNEYFQFYSATSAVSTPDGGTTLILLGSALTGLAGCKRWMATVAAR